MEKNYLTIYKLEISTYRKLISCQSWAVDGENKYVDISSLHFAAHVS